MHRYLLWEDQIVSPLMFWFGLSKSTFHRHRHFDAEFPKKLRQIIFFPLGFSHGIKTLEAIGCSICTTFAIYFWIRG